MSYAIQLFNDQNALVIDGQNSLLHWIFTAQYTVGPNTNKPIQVNWPQVVTSQQPPMVFQKLNANAYGCGNFRQLGSPGNWTGMSISPDIVGTTETYTYCVAVFMPPRSSGAWGVQMWDPQGNLILDAGYPQMVFQYATRTYRRDGPINQTGYNRTWYWTTTEAFSVSANSYVLISNFTGYLLDGAGTGNIASYGYFRATTTVAQYFQNYDILGSPSANNPNFNWPFIYAVPSHET